MALIREIGSQQQQIHIGIAPVLQRQTRLGNVLLAVEVQAEGPEILSRKRRHIGELPVACMAAPVVALGSRSSRGHFAPPTSMVANPGPVAEIYCQAAVFVERLTRPSRSTANPERRRTVNMTGLHYHPPSDRP